MNRHHRAVFAGNEIPDRSPNVLALTGLGRCQTHLDKLGPERKHSWAVVPNDDMVLVEAFEKVLGVAVLRFIRTIQPDDDAVNVGNLRKFIQNLGHRSSFQLGIQTGQYQRHFAVGRKGLKFIGQFIK